MWHVGKMTAVALLLAVGILSFGSPVQAASLTLTWTNNSAAQTGVQIERCLGAGCSNFSILTTVGATVATFTDTSLGEAQSASYRVRAVQGNPPNVFSGYSNTAGNTTGLNDPTGLQVVKP